MSITVQQLIERLGDFPPDMPVVVSGFDECGYSDLRVIDEVEIAPVKASSHGPDYNDQPGSVWIGPAFRACHLNF